MKTYPGRLPYDSSDPQEPLRFCQCLEGDPAAGVALDAILANRRTRQGKALKPSEVARQIEQIPGDRGHRFGCALIAHALDMNLWIVGTDFGDEYSQHGNRDEGIFPNEIVWNPKNQGIAERGQSTENLAHEFVHPTEGIMGGNSDQREHKVVRYENAIRYELGRPMRLEYGPGRAATEIASGGRDLLLQFKPICQCFPMIAPPDLGRGGIRFA